MHLPLNALRAFEASARHLSFTRAADEQNVTQAAISQQVRLLEERMGVALFRRLPRGLALTDEGLALLPTLTDAFERMQGIVAQVSEGKPRAVLTLGVVGTFAIGWLLPRLKTFQQSHPYIDLRLLTNNNRVDLAAEGLDLAIRFGDGAWHGTKAERILAGHLSPLCAPAVASRLRGPEDLAGQVLLRSYRTEEWQAWFALAGAHCPVIRGVVFDSSLTMAEAAAQGSGVALLPVGMFTRELQHARLVQPFDIAIDRGAYWLTRLKSKRPTAAMAAFRAWLLSAAGQGH
jgi:LysR family transcriptional regulator, regulator of gene expression of beta-lactamase